MIEAIREIGRYAVKKGKKSIDNPLEILIDNPESKPRNPTYKNIFLIVIQRANGNYEYKGIDVEEYSFQKLNLYLYRQGGKNGPDITPTSRITRVESEKGKKTTLEIKILQWFKKYKTTVVGEHRENDFLLEIGECIQNNKQRLQEDLERKYEGINKKEKAILTLKIDNKYIGEYGVFKNILLKSTEGFYSKYGKISKESNQVCSVCNKRESEVYGFVDTYKFYTVDKPGFVSGGFQQEYAWKNYPVCLNCALILEEGRKYLGSTLNFNFYGFSYLLIPNFVKGVSDKEKEEIFKIIEQRKDPKFTRKGIASLTTDESEILDLLSEQGNYLNLNFLFYKAKKGYDGSVFKILFYSENILPSRLKELFDAKKEIDQIIIFKECMTPVFENKKKRDEKPLEFNFGILRTFFPQISDSQTYNKYFLDMVNKIFADKAIDYYFLMSFIAKKIQDEFINGYSTKISTLKGFMLLNYLNKLKILGNFKEVKQMDGDKSKIFNSSGEINKKLNSFFNEFADFFNSNAKKAVFLEGVLTQLLLNIQYQERKATPFRAKLKGLKLNAKQIKKLLPEIQNKLEEYGKNYYRELESIISGYLVSAGDKWDMTNDEISYYFVLGMNLADLFKSENKEEGKENG